MSKTPEQIAAEGSEEAHQKAVVTWCRMESWRIKDARYRMICGSPNGMHTHIRTASRMKAAGMNKGFPDLQLPVVKRVMIKPQSYEKEFSVIAHPGLFIEMKKESRRDHANGGLDEDQIKWRDFLVSQGYAYHVCYTWIEARDVIKLYLA